MRLNDALTQIADIRERIQSAGLFRGYRSGPVAISGFLALLAATAQPMLVGRSMINIDDYIQLWGGVAVLSLLIAIIEMGLRSRREGAFAPPGMSRTAIEQLAPSLAAGAIITCAIRLFAPEHLTLLPALWMALFGLGICASRPILPKPIGWIGGYYLIASVLAICGILPTFSPWTMGLVFGGGQLGAAALLYWTLERSTADERSPEGDRSSESAGNE